MQALSAKPEITLSSFKSSDFTHWSPTFSLKSSPSPHPNPVMAFFKTGVKHVYACACFSKCSWHWRYLQEQQVAFYSQFYQLLQLCFGSIISIFSPSPSEPTGGAAEGFRQDLTCITGETTRRPPSCFWRECTHTCAEKKCDSSACWLSAVGARRPLLCSSAMKQI